MSIARCATIAGPGKIITAAGTYATTGDITVTMKRNIRQLQSALAGKLGGVMEDTEVEISAELVPVPIYATQLITLQPSNIGESLYGCSDAYLKIVGRDDEVWTFHASAVKKPPSVHFGRSKNLYGTCTWGAVVKSGYDVATSGNVLTRGSLTFTAPAAGFSPATWVTKGGKVTLDGTLEFGTQNGIDIDVSYATRPQEDDLNGRYGERLTEVSCVIRCKPEGDLVDDILERLSPDGAGAQPGVNLLDIAESILVAHEPLATGNLIFEAAAVFAEANGFGWGAQINRVGELTLQAVPTYSGGAVQPLYAFSLET